MAQTTSAGDDVDDAGEDPLAVQGENGVEDESGENEVHEQVYLNHEDLN